MVRTTPIFRPDHTNISSEPHLYFLRTTPIFRPEIMFSYFTPKLQLCINENNINNNTDENNDIK